MVIKTKKGYYEIIKNHKNAFDQAVFEECYIEECLDKYPYVVGDLSDNILRLKGFSDDNRKDNYIGRVEDYIEQSCTFLCAHYILKRINQATYDKLLLENKGMPKDYDDSIPSMEKVPFDKESLVLESTPKGKSRIVIDVLKQNKITLGVLPDSLKEVIQKDLKDNQTPVKDTKEVTYYSSSSEGFEPPVNPMPPRNNYNNKNKNKNKNNQKNNNNQNNANIQKNNNSQNNQKKNNNKQFKNNNKPNNGKK